MIRIGTRKSPLALIQTQIVIEALKQAYPDMAIETVPMSTRADQTSQSLAEIGGKALFTRELQEAILKDEIDCAVHSLKDVEFHELPLVFAAFLERENPFDIMVMREDKIIDDPAGKIRIGTCSPRRKSQALIAFPHTTCVDLRGNVGTRLLRILEGSIDAVILACAGLNRLGLNDQDALNRSYPGLKFVNLPPNIFVPAAGQGILVVECKPEKQTIFNAITHGQTAIKAQIERQFSSHFGGNCRTALGGYVEENSDEFILHGFYEGHYGQINLGQNHSDEAIKKLVLDLKLKN
jgi:hydroxymethylbilane synthase